MKDWELVAQRIVIILAIVALIGGCIYRNSKKPEVKVGNNTAWGDPTERK